MRKCLWTTTCLAVLAAAAACEAEMVTLKAGYEPGTYVMTMTMNMDGATTMPTGQAMSQKMTMMMVTEMEVGAADEQGTKKMRVTFKRVAQSVSAAGQSISYDSAAPEGGNPMLATTLGVMLDKPMEMKLGADGKVVEVSGMDKMWDAMAAENPRMAPMLSNMKQRFGDSYLSNMMDWSHRMMPDKPVAVGQDWDASIEMPIPMLGQVQVKQKCNLKELKDTPQGQVAVIAFTSEMQKEGGEEVEMGTPVSMTVDKAKISQAGTMEMMVASGMPLNYGADQSSAITMTMTPPADSGTEAMTMQIQQAGKINMTVRKGKYVAPTTKPAEEAPATAN